MLGLFGESEADGVVVAVSQAWSAVTMSTRGGRSGEVMDSATARCRKVMHGKPSLSASSRERSTSSSRVSML